MLNLHSLPENSLNSTREYEKEEIINTELMLDDPKTPNSIHIGVDEFGMHQKHFYKLELRSNNLNKVTEIKKDNKIINSTFILDSSNPQDLISDVPTPSMEISTNDITCDSNFQKKGIFSSSSVSDTIDVHPESLTSTTNPTPTIASRPKRLRSATAQEVKTSLAQNKNRNEQEVNEKDSDKLLILWLKKNSEYVNVVGDEDFRRFIHSLNSKYKLPQLQLDHLDSSSDSSSTPTSKNESKSTPKRKKNRRNETAQEFKERREKEEAIKLKVFGEVNKLICPVCERRFSPIICFNNLRIHMLKTHNQNILLD